MELRHIHITFRFVLLGYVLCCVFGLTMQHEAHAATDKTNRDLTRISWAHAVNSISELNKAINDDSIDMIEADVILGVVKNGTNDTIPIMGHPPANTSDLSLENFLKSVTTSKKKGVKLDFKSIEVFNASKDVMDTNLSKTNFSFWLNADILEGPITNGSKNVPVDADKFLNGAKKYTQAVLSLGWTTNAGPVDTKVNYTDEQISNMLDKLNKTEIKQNVTFAVRAGIAAESLNQMKKLLKWSNSSTLTIWLSNDRDVVDIPKLKKLIDDIGSERIYLDVPPELKKALRSSGSMTKYSVYALLLSFLMFIFNRNINF